MKQFINYIETIATHPIIPKKAKMTTTILMPELDTTEGIYRSLLPAYVINGSEKDLRMLVVGISPKTNTSVNQRDFDIKKELIDETDHFVFPFVSIPLRPVIEKLKDYKPSLKFSYYIDANYYLMPEAYPFAKEYKMKKMIEIIEDNIKAVDQVITTNNTLIDYIIARLKETHPGVTFGTDFKLQKLYVLPDIMKTEYTNEVIKGRIKALIIGDEYHFSDINYILGILKDFKAKYKESFELTLLGWDGKRGEKNYMKDIPFKHYARTTYSNYFQTINHIAPSVLIISANVNKFNDTTKNYVKYLEFAQMNIPVVCPNIEPFKELITTNVNGFLCEDKDAYAFQMETMLSEPAKYEGVTGIAYATAKDYSITDPNNIKKLVTIYFPGYGK